MEKTLSAFEARRNFGKVLQDVVAKGDKIVVERHGEPVAVVVPLSVYEQWQCNRVRAYNALREIAEQVNMSPEEAEELAEEAVRWARSNKDV